MATTSTPAARRFERRMWSSLPDLATDPPDARLPVPVAALDPVLLASTHARVAAAHRALTESPPAQRTPPRAAAITRALLRSEAVASAHFDGVAPGAAPASSPATQPLHDDLERFIARDDLAPVLQAAIVHAQLATIDGGHAARAASQRVLAGAGTLPPSTSLQLRARGDLYVRALAAWQAGDADHWISFFADVVRDAAAASAAFVAQLDLLVDLWLLQAGRPRAGSATRRIVEQLPALPVLDIPAAADATGASREAARRAMEQLERAGVVIRRTPGRRNRRWECVGLRAVVARVEREVLRGPVP